MHHTPVSLKTLFLPKIYSISKERLVLTMYLFILLSYWSRKYESLSHCFFHQNTLTFSYFALSSLVQAQGCRSLAKESYQFALSKNGLLLSSFDLKKDTILLNFWKPVKESWLMNDFPSLPHTLCGTPTYCLLVLHAILDSSIARAACLDWNHFS